MADFAPPVVAADTLPTFKPSEKTDDVRRISGFIRNTIYPKFVAFTQESGGPGKEKKMTLKEYVKTILFPLVDTEFEITGRYALHPFKETMYSMLNSKKNHNVSVKKAPKEESATPEPGPSRHRKSTALNEFKADPHFNRLINTQKNEALEKDGIKVEQRGGQGLKMFSEMAQKMFEESSDEVKKEMADRAEAKEKARSLAPSEEELAMEIAENQKMIGNLVLQKLRSLVGRGPGKVGDAVFSVKAAFKDAEGTVYCTEVSLGAIDGRDVTAFMGAKADEPRFRTWAKDNLYVVLQEEGDDILLPGGNLATISKKEMVRMLLAYFGVDKYHTLSLSTTGDSSSMRDIRQLDEVQLRGYYAYTLTCQEEGTTPIHAVTPKDRATVDEDATAAAAADSGDRTAPGAKADDPATADEAAATASKQGRGQSRGETYDDVSNADFSALTPPPGDEMDVDTYSDLTPPPLTPPPLDFSSALIPHLENTDEPEVPATAPGGTRGNRGRGGARARGKRGRGGRGGARGRGSKGRGRGGAVEGGGNAGELETFAPPEQSEPAKGVKRKQADTTDQVEGPAKKKQNVVEGSGRATRSKAPPAPPQPSPQRHGYTKGGYFYYVFTVYDVSTPSLHRLAVAAVNQWLGGEFDTYGKKVQA
ncbi:hypothetical protein DFH07DRAFT_775792 [Mycena maculata]|uniref:Uncharacterized protein n=1 Tax=Mycena maculata TaxID=230809 RepID=A0AAD7ISX0_9AGAR|nr:hypothetical protein DFH07DRAFT_775792 [Mycena maculata]